MNKFFTTLLTLAAISIALPAALADCTPTTSTPEVSAGGLYLDNDLCQPVCLFSIWLYQESNDMEGLQRGDEVVDDTCGGAIDSDTDIF